MSDLIRKSKQLQCKQNISDKIILHVKGVFSVVGPVFKIYKNGGNNCNDVSISVVMLVSIHPWSNRKSMFATWFSAVTVQYVEIIMIAL